MALPEPVRNALLRLLPWYKREVVEARHANSARILRNARRGLAMVESYRRASERLDQIGGK